MRQSDFLFDRSLKAIILFLVFLFIACPYSASEIVYSEGTVEKYDLLSESWKPLGEDSSIENGDVLKVRESGVCEVRLDGGHTVVIDEFSLVEFKQAERLGPGSGIRLRLDYGTIQNTVEKLDDESSFEVEMPTAVVGVRGTEFDVEVLKETESSVGVFSGNVEVSLVDLAGRVREAKTVTQGRLIRVADGRIAVRERIATARREFRDYLRKRIQFGKLKRTSDRMKKRILELKQRDSGESRLLERWKLFREMNELKIRARRIKPAEFRGQFELEQLKTAVKGYRASRYKLLQENFSRQENRLKERLKKSRRHGKRNSLRGGIKKKSR